MTEKKYHCFLHAYSLSERRTFLREDEMIEWYQKTIKLYPPKPGEQVIEVIYGTLLELEPAEIVKSWRIKEVNP